MNVETLSLPSQVRSKEKCTMATVQLDVQIEKGAPDGERITFQGKSEQR